MSSLQRCLQVDLYICTAVDWCFTNLPLIFIQVLIILTDHRTCIWDENEQVMNETTNVKTNQIKVVTVAFGPHINIRELQDIDDGPEVLHFGENESLRTVGKRLLQSKC